MDRRFTIITSVRNERVRILEWAVYHRLIGFNNIVVYYNDCTDGTAEILQAMDRAGIVTAVLHHPQSSKTAQQEAFRKAIQNYGVHTSDWVVAIDTDEYINIHVGRGLVTDLVDAVPEADLFTLNNRMFGSSGAILLDESNSLRQFIHASNVDHPRNAIFKILRRGSPLGRRAFLMQTAVVANGSGILIDKYPLARVLGRPEPPRLPPDQIGYAMVQLNHYAVRSVAEFFLKKFRGSRTGPDRFNLAYWQECNLNDVEELSITRWADTIDAEIDRLRAGNASLVKAYADTQERFRSLLDTAMTHPDFQKITMQPMW